MVAHGKICGKMWYHILGHFLAESLILLSNLGGQKMAYFGPFLDMSYHEFYTPKIEQKNRTPPLKLTIFCPEMAIFNRGFS